MESFSTVRTNQTLVNFENAAMDNVGFLDNPKQKALLEKNEHLLYADNIKKWSNLQIFPDTRILVVTTENIYNVKKDKLQRTIPFSLLSGISLSMQGLKNEFVIHVKNQHDYRLQTVC